MMRLPLFRRAQPDRLRQLAEEHRGYSDFALYRRLLSEARPYWPHIAGIFFLSLLSTPFTLLAPVPLKIVVDNVIGNQPVGSALDWLPDSITGSDDALLAFAIGAMLALALANQLRDLAITVLKTYTGEKLVLSFRARLFGHVQRMSLSYHDSKGTADSIYRIQNDAPSIQQIAIDGVIPFVTSIVTLASIFFVVYRINWQLLLVGLSVAPILYFVSRSYRPRLRMQSREVKKLDSSSWSVVQEALTALRVVKAFGREERERDRFVTQSGNRVKARVTLSFNEAWFALLLGMTTAVGAAAALYIGARLVNSGALTLGEMLLVTAYLAQIYDPLTKISKKAGSLQLAMASAERAFTLLDQQPDVAERKHAIPLIRASGAIEFRDVSFAYGTDKPVIEHLSLQLPAGTTLGIAGTTGAGKTTLVSLLTRFYDPRGGNILLDGVDLRDYKLADLRNQFAIVLQEPVLFSTTIGENIGYARPGASFDDIVAAARSADAHNFISRLPEAYDTPVGERGMRLSGGERQRISLARAFLKDAPILLLDEPTSSVDMKTETSILESLERLMAGRTTIMIAHRLSTLERCDIRIELEYGQIIDLVESSPTYSGSTDRRPALTGTANG